MLRITLGGWWSWLPSIFPGRALQFTEIKRICELVLESASDRASPVLKQFYEEQIKNKWEQYVHKSISQRKQSSGLTQEFDEGI